MYKLMIQKANKVSAKTIVETYFNAMAKGDIAKALTCFAANVKWHQPGMNKFSGLKSSPDEIGQMIFGMIEDAGGSLIIRPNGLLTESGDLVAAPIRFTFVKRNQSLDMGGLFEVKNGEIAYVWLFSENQQEDGLWRG
ncbi:nuclear transport factor 2 family protein [Fulvivirga ulvae]|uniref:nuclear transport factor 2 family protein n=1 Tax=Fulvivirga ulvae TaxID=2904245 RepID=UPI001F46A404|nr:nuclear transport factor 2 family protein [Fulvivirga ulvae]UII31342.1 nuclear transport factor 2 family protein [Fulvivirga ulvae]